LPHAHARCDDGPVDASDISKAADDLYRAQRVRKPIPPLTSTYGAIPVDDAYQIQLANIAKHLAEGATVTGHKVGLSAKAMQRMLGVIGASLQCNGRVREAGASGAVLGNPAVAAAWLANKVAGFGVALEPGRVIMPGSCTRMIPVRPGDVVRAEFDRLGYVSLSFCPQQNP
jgi:2-keto-4-pentenoate hydratase